MVVRVLFLLLIALNLGAGAWLLFGREAPRTPPPATDPGVPELRLVSEARSPTSALSAPPVSSARSASVAALPPAVAPAASPSVAILPPAAAPAASLSSMPSQQSAPPASASSQQPAPASSAAPALATSAPRPAPTVAETCARLGPFATPAAQQAAIAALSPHVSRVQSAQEPVGRSRGFLVYLPASASHAAAAEATRALAAKGVHDYFVVGSGDMQNAVSLGVYDAPANAQKRVDELEKLGFAAKVKQRFDAEPVYWAEFAVPAGSAFDWRAWMPRRGDLQAKPIACF